MLSPVAALAITAMVGFTVLRTDTAAFYQIPTNHSNQQKVQTPPPVKKIATRTDHTCNDESILNNVADTYNKRSEQQFRGLFGRILKIYDIKPNPLTEKFGGIDPSQTNSPFFFNMLQQEMRKNNMNPDHQCIAKIMTTIGQLYISYGWKIVDGDDYIEQRVYENAPPMFMMDIEPKRSADGSCAKDWHGVPDCPPARRK